MRKILAGLRGVWFLLSGAYHAGARREREKREAQRQAEMAESRGE